MTKRAPQARRLPNFTEEPGAVVPALSGSGLRLAAGIYQRSDGVRSIWISGVCQCLDAELKGLQVSMLQAVSLLAVYRTMLLPVSFSAIGQGLVFDDDVRRVGPHQRAFFEVDLFTQARIPARPGIYDISGSVGPHLAPVIRVKL
jgi:hypothetical protein